MKYFLILSTLLLLISCNQEEVEDSGFVDTTIEIPQAHMQFISDECDNPYVPMSYYNDCADDKVDYLIRMRKAGFNEPESLDELSSTLFTIKSNSP